MSHNKTAAVVAYRDKVFHPCFGTVYIKVLLSSCLPPKLL